MKDAWTAAMDRDTRAEDLKTQRIVSRETRLARVPRWRRWLARLMPWRGDCPQCWGNLKWLNEISSRTCHECGYTEFVGSDY